MNPKLPNKEPSQSVPFTESLPKKKNFPSIFRFITEYTVSDKAILHTKLIIIGFFSGLLLVSIVYQSSKLIHNIQAVQHMRVERGKINQEIAYWKQIANQYEGYRDVYFRIAALEYKVGNTTESKQYMEKALELDPNFEAGRVLGEKIKEK